MNYNFVEYVKNINLYAIIDAVLVLTVLIVSLIFFAYKRNVAILVLILTVVVLDVAVNVLSELNGGTILAVSKYVLHYLMIFAVVLPIVVYRTDLKNLVQKISNPRDFAVGENASSDDELRNAAIDIAKGEYITFIDSDDYVELDYVKFLYDNLISNNADISMGYGDLIG